MKPNSSHNIKNDFLLLLAAAIWGFAFVAQRKGMEHVGPMLFNACRFGLGALSLVPLLIYSEKKRSRALKADPESDKNGGLKVSMLGAAVCGIALFTASAFQQWGIVYTTAGKAGFITGLYVVLVPIINHFFGHIIGKGTWTGAFLALIGLYFLSINQGFTVNFGDFLVFVSAFFWAVHITAVGIFSYKVGPIKLAFLQFAVTAFLSLIVAIPIEEISLSGIRLAALPILYGGIMSAGIAFTIQVVVQEKAHPAHAAIIMSLETFFAALGGWMILGEQLGARDIFGCTLMLAGMLVSQLSAIIASDKSKPKES
jgi:drug/metabolite transporter (DMT)-like permease